MLKGDDKLQLTNYWVGIAHWVGIALHPWLFVFDIAIFVLKGDV